MNTRDVANRWRETLALAALTVLAVVGAGAWLSAARSEATSAGAGRAMLAGGGLPPAAVFEAYAAPLVEPLSGPPGAPSAYFGAMTNGAIAPAPWAPVPRLRPGAPPSPTIGAAAAVVIDDASGAMLYSKDGHRSLPPASLTKIATAILAIERLDLDAWVETDVDSRVMRGSSVMGLVPGDRFSVRDLLFGLMHPSGNDAALALGRATSGTDPAFVLEMNRLVARLGLSGTRFANPHGLGARGHGASAHDLAQLARYGMSLAAFRHFVGTGGASTEGSKAILMHNSNSFLFKYEGADGVKIGYTRSAGNTLVASAMRDGHRLYATVLNAPDRDGDAAALLDWAFANLEWPED